MEKKEREKLMFELTKDLFDRTEVIQKENGHKVWFNSILTYHLTSLAILLQDMEKDQIEEIVDIIKDFTFKYSKKHGNSGGSTT